VKLGWRAAKKDLTSIKGVDAHRGMKGWNEKKTASQGYEEMTIVGTKRRLRAL